MLSNRVKYLTPSMTLGISSKVKQLKSDGIEVLNLSIGEPDFFTPQAAKQGAIDAINNNLTKYDAASGVRALKQAICDKLLAENQLTYTAEQIVVSSGAKHAITNALLAITNVGDDVIIPAPYWLSYPEMVKLVGAQPNIVDTQFDNNFKMTPQELLNAITDKTKAVIINNPSNPTGAVYSRQELSELAQICLESDIYILADEIYERIYYGDAFSSVAALSDEIKAITVLINGMSKSLSMTGWRIGYTATTIELAKAMSAIQGHLVSHPSTISQYAALKGLTDAQDDITAMRESYRQRCQMATKLLLENNDLSIVKPDGAFYIFINIAALRSKLALAADQSLSLKVCDDLLDKERVALVPGKAFGNDDFIRMSYAASDDTIREGITRLNRYIASVLE